MKFWLIIFVCLFIVLGFASTQTFGATGTIFTWLPKTNNTIEPLTGYTPSTTNMWVADTATSTQYCFRDGTCMNTAASGSGGGWQQVNRSGDIGQSPTNTVPIFVTNGTSYFNALNASNTSLFFNLRAWNTATVTNDLFVGRNATVTGNFVVQGSTTVVDVTVVNVQNNGNSTSTGYMSVGGGSPYTGFNYSSGDVNVGNNLYVGHNATTTGKLYLGSHLEMAELYTGAPSLQATGTGAIYWRMDEITDSLRPFGRDHNGNEYNLTGGGSSGCTTLDCLTDTVITAAALNDVLQFDGTNWIDIPLNFNQLSGNATIAQGGTNITSYTLGDILYSSATNVLSKLSIGTSGLYLQSNGTTPSWVGAVDLTTAQNVSGVKTFNSYPKGPGGLPTISTELVDKAYADSVASGFLYKQQVVAASTGNTATSGPQTVDGVAVIAGDRVLLKNEPESQNNGCYVVAAGNWTLCTDSDTDAEVNPGTAYFVPNGTTNQKSGWAVLTADPITPGTTPITFGQISGATVYTGITPIQVSGTEIKIATNTNEFTLSSNLLTVLKNNSLTSNSSGLAVATTTNFDWTGRHTWTDARPSMLNASTTNVGTLRVYGSTIFNTVSYTWPVADGSSGQVLSTNGSGSLSWTTAASGSGGGNTFATTTARIFFVSSGDVTQVWDNLPAVEATLFGSDNNYIITDLTAVNAYRIFLSQDAVGPAAGRIWLQYCIGTCTSVSTWVNATSTNINGTLAVATANTSKVTSYLYLPDAAKTLVTLRIRGGCGQTTCTADPSFRELGVEFQELTSAPSTQSWQKTTVPPGISITPTTTGAGIYLTNNATSTTGLFAGSFFQANDSRASTTGSFNIGTTLGTLAGSALFGVGDLYVGSDATITRSLTVDATTLFVDADNNQVGIGTVSPISGLDVRGSYIHIENSGAAPASGPSGLVLGSVNNSYKYIQTYSLQPLILNPSANSVGIGDTSPLSLFTVGSGDKFQIDASGNATTSGWFNIGTTKVGTTLGSLIGAGDLYVGSNATITKNLSIAGDLLSFSSVANPTIYSSSYITMPGGLFVNSSGIAYFNNEIKVRNGIANDTANNYNGDVAVNDGFRMLSNATTSGWLNIGTTAIGTTLGSRIGAGDLYVGRNATTTGNLTVSSSTAMTTGYGPAIFVDAFNSRLGVATTTPGGAHGEAFTVRGGTLLENPTTATWLRVGDGITVQSKQIILNGPANSASQQQFQFQDAGTAKWTLYRIGGTDDLRVYSHTLASEVMTFSPNGKVAIGKGFINPTSTLSVLGTADIRGNATTTGRFVIGTTAPPELLVGNGDLYISDDATITDSLHIGSLFHAFDSHASTTGSFAVGITGGGIVDASARFGAGDLYVGDDATVTDNLTVVGNIFLTTDGSSIMSNTVDGADNHFLKFAAAGASGDDTRGATVSVFGNEYNTFALNGALYLAAGNTTNGHIYFGSGGATQMLLDSGGRFGVGTTTQRTLTGTPRIAIDAQTGYGMWVEADDNTVALFNRNATAGLQTIIEIAEDGATQGTIQVNAGTVTYNAFTGSHYALIDEPIEEGMLVSMTGKYQTFHDTPNFEPLYNVTITNKANDSKVLGSFLGVADGKPQSVDNPAVIMAVGNGDMWVTDNGQIIKAGDYLISSDVPGHAMKDPETFGITYIIGRAGEDVDWSTVSDVSNGVKHKKISVFYENFVRDERPIDVIEDNKMSSLVVRQTAEFQGAMYVEGNANFKSKVTFEKDVEVRGRIYATSDQGGTVIIPAGATSTDVIFNIEYEEAPKVISNLVGDDDTFVLWKISRRTAQGFRVRIQSPVDKDLLFDWLAFPIIEDKPIKETTLIKESIFLCEP